MKKICVFLLAFGTLSAVALPLLASTVTPYVILKSEKVNPDCQYICAGCYYQLKVDPPPQPAGVWITKSDSHLTVTVTCVTSNDDDEMMSFDWSSNIPVNAVIVKSKDSHVYKYDTPATSDTWLTPAPGGHAVSHITFCYSVPQITVTVDWGATLEIDQPMIADWAANPVEYTLSFGELRVSVTATIDYDLKIYYTVGLASDFSPPYGAMPLSFEPPSGIWTPIPPEGEAMAPLPAPTGIGTKEHTYPMRVDLALLGAGDRTAGDSITFEVHVMPTDPEI